MGIFSVRQIEFASCIVPFTLSQLGAASNLKASRLRSDGERWVGKDGRLPAFSDFGDHLSELEQGSFILHDSCAPDMRRMKIWRDFLYEKAHTVV
jgi:hypothetical protein